MLKSFYYSWLICQSKSIKWDIHYITYLILTSCSYKLRIQGMLLKEEFASNMSYLEPSINSMIIAAQGKDLFVKICSYRLGTHHFYSPLKLIFFSDLMTNKPLKEVLYMVLVAGNFLNSVSWYKLFVYE